jgi:hypothetical protein
MFRACKFNQQGVCGKYKTVEEMVKDFENGEAVLSLGSSLDKYPNKRRKRKKMPLAKAVRILALGIVKPAAHAEPTGKRRG